MNLGRSVIQRAVAALTVEQTCEVEHRRLAALLNLFPDNQLSVSDDVVETCVSHFGQILAHLAGKEGEIVYKIFIFSDEVLAQFGVLCGYAERTRVEVALAHHDASEHDECQRSEAELLGTEQRHEHNVAPGFELSVHLQAHLTAQSVFYQRLLCLAYAYLGRYSGKAHARCRRCSRASLGTGDDYQIGLCLGYAGCNGANAALGNELHAYGCLGIDVLEVEYQLGKVLNRIDVVVRRRRDKRYAGYRVACLGYNLVHLKSGQLSAFAGLCALCHLYLKFFCVDKILGCYAETA